MFEKNKRNTVIVMLTAVTILILWDLVVFFTGPTDDTESHIILEFATNNFTLPFAMSGLLGHWFWPRNSPPFGLSTWQSFFLVVIPTLLAMSFTDLFYTTPGWMLPLIAPVGYTFGSLFWPQQKLK